MEENGRDLSLEKRIDAYVKGKLSEEEADRLWVELLKRPDYMDLLETEIAVKQMVEEQEASADSEKTNSIGKGRSGIGKVRSGNKWKWVAASAAVLALFAIGWFVLTKEEPKALKKVALSEINIGQNLAAPEVHRANEVKLSAAELLLNRGFQTALSGSTDGALQIYGKIIADYDQVPAVAKAFLNRGILLYNTAKYQKATSAFESALQQGLEDDLNRGKAYWYLANSYIHTDQLQKALQAVRKAQEMDGLYKEEAIRLLERLTDDLKSD